METLDMNNVLWYI